MFLALLGTVVSATIVTVDTTPLVDYKHLDTRYLEVYPTATPTQRYGYLRNVGIPLAKEISEVAERENLEQFGFVQISCPEKRVDRNIARQIGMTEDGKTATESSLLEFAMRNEYGKVVGSLASGFWKKDAHVYINASRRNLGNINDSAPVILDAAMDIIQKNKDQVADSKICMFSLSPKDPLLGYFIDNPSAVLSEFNDTPDQVSKKFIDDNYEDWTKQPWWESKKQSKEEFVESAKRQLVTWCFSKDKLQESNKPA